MTEGQGQEPQRIGPGYSFRARLTAGVVAGSVIPLAGFGLVLVAAEIARRGSLDTTVGGLLVFVLAAAIILAVLFAYFLAGNLTRPLRAIAQAVERVSGGDLSVRVEVAGEDELSQLVESHNRLVGHLPATRGPPESVATHRARPLRSRRSPDPRDGWSSRSSRMPCGRWRWHA